MNIEPVPKKRKLNRKAGISEPPTVTVQIAEPVDTENRMETEEEEREKKRNGRQCNLDEIPFEFLPEREREAIRMKEDVERQLKESEDSANSKKAKTLLGIFIGAGIGMYLAYIVKDKFFSPAVVSAIENATNIIDNN